MGSDVFFTESEVKISSSASMWVRWGWDAGLGVGRKSARHPVNFVSTAEFSKRRVKFCNSMRCFSDKT